MPVETSKTEGELTKEAPVFTGASPAKVLSKSHHPALFPELSPTTTTEKYSSLLSDTSTGMGRGVSQARLISDIQKGYGNSYTERVITGHREKRREELEGKEEPTEAKETEQVTVPKEAKKTPHFRIRSESLGSPGPTFNLVGTQNLHQISSIFRARAFSICVFAPHWQTGVLWSTLDFMRKCRLSDLCLSRIDYG